MSTEVKIDGEWRELGTEIKYESKWWFIDAIHYDGRIELIRTAKDALAPMGCRDHRKIIYEDGIVNHDQVTLKLYQRRD